MMRALILLAAAPSTLLSALLIAWVFVEEGRR